MNTKYLYYVLNREAPHYVNSGMGNPKLMSNVMARINLPVPPLEVQRLSLIHIFTIHERGEFLYNAKPRFGKTLTVYDLSLIHI